MRRTGCLGVGAMLIILSLLWTPRVAEAGGPQGRNFGLGIILGDPSGITAKLWLSSINALDFHLAFDVYHDAFAFYCDYLFHFDVGIGGSAVDVPLYVGIGGKLGAWRRPRDRDRDHDVYLGARVPVGLAFLFKGAPIEAFIEIAPGLRLLPRTTLDIDGGIGGRFYF